MASTTIPVISKLDLEKRIGQGYRALRSALEALPRERFTEKLRTGWSLNENLAHLAAWEETVPPRVAGVLERGEDPKLSDDVAAWEDRTASRLRTFRESGEAKRYLGVDDTDEFNAAVVERTRGRTASDVLRDVDDAHERLVAEVQKLTPEQIHENDDWIIAVVA